MATPEAAVVPDTARSDGDARRPRLAALRGFSVGFWFAVAWLAVVLVLSVGAGVLPIPDPAKMDLFARSSGPSAAHLLGTDALGRDLLARTIEGLRVSLAVGFLSPFMAVVVGGALGLIAGYHGGRVEWAMMSLADVLLAFPPLVLALVLTAYFGTALVNIILILGLLTVPAAIRITRAVTLAAAEREFVTAARALGASDLRIMLKEILPNVFMPVLAFFMVAMAVIIVAEGALSFLGLGVPPPMASLGGMIAAGRDQLQDAPHIAFVPAGAMFLTVLALNLVSDALQARAEPDRGTS